jgi:hypothetical protein
MGDGELFSREFVFANATKRANKIFSNLLPWGACRDTFCAYGRIILPATNITYVLFHKT